MRHAFRITREYTNWANLKSGWECIPAAAVRNVFHIWSVAVGRSKSYSARTTSTAIPQNDMDTSTAHFRTRSWTASSKNLVNQVSLPSADRLLDALNSFQTALTWPEAQQRIQALLERGLQREVDFENRWPEVLGTLVET